jgi:hypothetical protein
VLPSFCHKIDRHLAHVAGRVRMLGALAPADAEGERLRVIGAFEAGGEACPRWTYAAPDLAGVDEELSAIAREIDEEAPLGAIYAARVRELLLEARIARAAGTRQLAPLARERFALDEPDAVAALATASDWIRGEASAEPGPLHTSDGPEPESLASRMRAELGARRAPFVVEVRRDLASLAATGERAVFIASERMVTDEDVRRTVLHEVSGHVMPRMRAATLEPWIFRIGTARGTDDQEGFALVLEERSGVLGARRKRSLAARHLACSAMDRGASFVECVRALLGHALVPRDAVLVAERAYRGGAGSAAGLGRERVYLARFARVRAHLAEHPEDEAVLASGLVTLAAIGELRTFIG